MTHSEQSSLQTPNNVIDRAPTFGILLTLVALGVGVVGGGGVTGLRMTSSSGATSGLRLKMLSRSI